MLDLRSLVTSTEVAVEPEAGADVQALVAGAARGGQRVVLELEGIRFSRRPGHSYQVYLNLPAGQAAVPSSIYYVGSLGFYGHQGASHTTQFDITETVRALAARGEWDPSRVRVALAPSRLEMPPGVQAPPPADGARGSVDHVRIFAG